MSHSPRRNERAATVWLTIAMIGGVVAAFGYWTDATERTLGVGLAICFIGTGLGLVTWARALDLDEESVDQRESLAVDPVERAAFDEQVDATVDGFGRRKLLLALFGGSVASMLIAFVGPVGSLGPKPRAGRRQTGWSAGTRLVTADGRPVAVDQVGFDQLVTVFPEGQVGRDDSQVVLLRVRPELLTRRTVETGTVDGWVAYSKICSHAGCSVGLFGVDDRPPDVVRQLVCPCHQSVFDPLDAAEPVGGPAPRPLAQLPLDANGGVLVARSDFAGPVGPITWDEG